VPRPYVPPAPAGSPPWEAGLRPSGSAIIAAGRSLARNRHVSVPIGVPPVLWLAGETSFALHAAPYIATASAVAAAGLWYFAPHRWDRPPELLYARLSAVAAASWVTAAAFTGPAAGLPGIILGSALAPLSTAWGVLWWRHKRPRGRRRREALIGKWDAWWQSHCWSWNLGGSRVVDAKASGVTVALEVAGLPGRHALSHVQQVVPLIESALDGMVDVGRVSCETVKGKPSHFRLRFKRENPLAAVVQWDPDIAPRSVHDLAPLGVTETGLWRMGSLRCNSFIIGTTRSGKTNHLLARIASLSGCPDDRQVLIALKGGRSARPVLEAGSAEHVITTVDEARMFLLMTTREIDARGAGAYDGDDQLKATTGLPAWHVEIDETHGLTSVTNGDAECARYLATLASQGSAVEIYTDIDTQYGSLEESVRTEQTRGNLRLRFVYRVESASHGQFAFDDWSRYDASRLEELGTFLMKDGPETTAEQVRAPHMPHELLKRICEQNAALIGPRDPVRLFCGAEMSPLGVTWQEWWDTRWLRLDPRFREFSPQYQAAVRQFGVTAAAAAAASESSPAPSPAGSGARAVADRIEADLDAMYGEVPEGWTPPPADLRPVLERQRDMFATALAGAAGGISPAQLKAESGMSTSWIHPMLAALIEHGAVTQLSRGRYAPLPGTSVTEAMEAITRERDALFRDARKVNAA